VLVVHGGTVGLGSTLTASIEDSFGQQPTPTPTPTPTPQPGGKVGKQVAALLAQAVQHFQAADAALKAGDLGTYQAEVQKAQALIKQANDLAAKSGQPTPTPSPSAPTPSPSAS
jgi:uncharacterized membrane protein (UPF0182 family)